MTYKRKKINDNPQDIDKNNWFYDGEKYLTFIHEVIDKNGNLTQTDSFNVSIEQLTDFISQMKYIKI